MTWYLALYLLLYVAVSVGGLIDDRRRRWTWLLAMGVTLGVGILSVVAFAYPHVARPLGHWLWGLVAFAILLEAWSLGSDLRDLAREGGSRIERMLIATVVTVTALPAYLLGAFAAIGRA